jgi:hypothetical protein
MWIQQTFLIKFGIGYLVLSQRTASDLVTAKRVN